MKVSDILRVKGGTLFTVQADEPLSRAMTDMAEKDLGSLVVMAKGALAGMLTFREVIRQIVKNGGQAGAALVRDAMDAQPLTCTGESDIDDVRESPALDIIRLLEERGAHVEFYDPFVHQFREEGHVRTGVELSDDMLRWADAVVVVTDHTNVDYQRVVDHAALLVDTRNVTAGLKAGRARIIPLASGTRTVGATS